MGLKKFNAKQVQKMSMMEIANKVLIEQKEEMNFIELFHKVADIKQFSENQKENYLARFYTDLNVDGRFTTIGSNKWGLKRWYPVDQTSEKLLAEVRKREKIEDDDLSVDFDEDEEEELTEDEIVYDEYELSTDDDDN